MPSIEQLKHLGEVIREARQGKGWSLKLLSEKSGVGHSYLSNIERGYVNPERGPVTPSDDILAQLSEALNLPIFKMQIALGRVADGTSSRPMMTFVEQKLRESTDGTVHDLTPDQADQLVSELEELVGLRIAQVQRQSQGNQ